MKAGRGRGFTLLEVMIAVAIFGICISIVYGLYTSVVSVVENVEERMRLNDRVRIAFTRLSRDLHGLYRGEQGFLTGRDSVDPSGDEPVLEFISAAHLSFAPDAAAVPLSVVRYYVEQDEDDETYYLLRSDTPVSYAGDQEDVEEGRKFRVSEGLAEVRVQYLDREGDEQSDWETTEGTAEEQEDDSRFPHLVAIELVFPSSRSGDEEGTVYTTAVLLRPAVIEFGEGIGG
jgi:type II secretion system protein J